MNNELKYNYAFSIAGINIVLHMPYEIIINDSFKSFVSSEEENAVHVYFREDESIKFTGGNLITTKIPFRLYEDERGFYRIFHDHKLLKDKPYAVGRILSDTREEIYFLPEDREFFSESHNVFSHIAFEELLLRHEAMILHAAFINTEYGGILFSGPSGVGKSTQADLWCRYREAEQINGDRPILRKEGEQWKAFGSPYAGSSQCWENKDTVLRGIVMIEQGTECSIYKLEKAEAFRKLYEGMIINTWNSAYVKKIVELIEALVMEVPVYHMICTKEQDSVIILESLLKGEK